MTTWALNNKILIITNLNNDSLFFLLHLQRMFKMRVKNRLRLHLLCLYNNKINSTWFMQGNVATRFMYGGQCYNQLLKI